MDPSSVETPSARRPDCGRPKRSARVFSLCSGASSRALLLRPDSTRGGYNQGMQATSHETHHGHHELPVRGRELTGVAVSATLHCLVGCAIGGMVIGTALGLTNAATLILAIVLAFLFGYSLTSLPLLRAGLAIGAVIPIALASDTLSIATMELVDNAIVLLIPGAMDAGLDTL